MRFSECTGNSSGMSATGSAVALSVCSPVPVATNDTVQIFAYGLGGNFVIGDQTYNISSLAIVE